MTSLRAHERGVAILFAMFTVMMASTLILALITVAKTNTDAGLAQLNRLQAQYAAEAGISDAVANVVTKLASGATQTVGSTKSPIQFGGGAYWVSATDNKDGTATLVAHGRRQEEVVTLQVRARMPASLMDFTIYAGNESGGASNLMKLGGTGANADAVSGKVHVNGSLAISGAAKVVGNVSVTDKVTGTAISGTKTEGAMAVAPPDLKAMNYEASADFKINAATTFDKNGFLPATDPRHIFAKEWRGDLSTQKGFKFTNTNYFLGDPWENSNLDNLSVPVAGNRKVYFIDGNLWIEPQGTTLTIVKGPADGTVITIVVKGNIYFADTLAYQNAAKDGIMFIALSDGESYTDLNGNNKYDAGEPLLHDNGDGVYTGNNEGSGNVYFGDPNGGPLGHVQSFIYAENNFEDQVAQNGKPLPFQVTGMLSAGNEMRIERDVKTTHAQMLVTGDPRIANGTLKFPGTPGGSSAKKVGVISWSFAPRAW